LLTTGESIVMYKELLNAHPENRNMVVHHKSSVGRVWNAGEWVPKLKREIVDHCFKKTARNLSDRLDIVGVDTPTEMVTCLEVIATEGLSPSDSVLCTEGVGGLTVRDHGARPRCAGGGHVPRTQ
jgi:hypothetical protein